MLSQEDWRSNPADPADPTLAWAGHCGDFFDAAYNDAAKAGIAIDACNVCQSFDDVDFTYTMPVGIKDADLHEMGFWGNLNHVWVLHQGKHYDASCTEGVGNPFELRVLRQVLVESLEDSDPAKLAALCAEHPWWQESADLLKDFVRMRNAIEARSAISMLQPGVSTGAGVKHQEQDLEAVAQWLKIDKEDLCVQMLVLPIETFGNAIDSMLSSYQHFPQDKKRTDKILKALKEGEKPLPIYVEKDADDLFILEGRHRIVAQYLAGFKEVKVGVCSDVRVASKNTLAP